MCVCVCIVLKKHRSSHYWVENYSIGIPISLGESSSGLLPYIHYLIVVGPF